MDYTKSYEIIKTALWGNGKAVADENAYETFHKHSIDALPASIISRLLIPDELKKKWKEKIIQQITYNMQCITVQNNLPIMVPYVILKGTSAAQYYPYPEYRALGDIDIMTKREDFDLAYKQLLNSGFVIHKELEREIGFVKDGIMVELHRYFASLNDPKKAKYMDDLIIENINPSHILPDEINGLVLLEHINQHLEKGLGLRQILDWMMFVDKCLPDGKWMSIKKYTEAIGLHSLASTATKMCELYLGLPHREWCNQANEKLCRQLMEYVLACGDFGNIRSENIGTGENVFYFGRTPKSMFDLLQNRGLANWKATQKHEVLRPFAWMYQIFRYIRRGLARKDASTEIIKDHKAARQRIKMFEALGVRQSSKGLAVYRNGRYIKR